MIDPAIQKLVCGACWRSFFSIDHFQTAWVAGLSPTASEKGGFVYTTPTRKEMQHAINRMCEWCDLICEEIEFYYQHKTKTKELPLDEATLCIAVRFKQTTIDFDGRPVLQLQLVVENSWTPTYLVHTIDDDNVSRYISAREVLLHLDSRSSYALAMKRIGECLYHEHCPPPERAVLPTRKIDCSNQVQPRLITSNGAKDFYAALSYVWGESQPHCTTIRNLEFYHIGIEIQHIPKTIRDAISVTRALGLRYLWVDALCIVQDSKDNKVREISRMRTIFRNSYITIIAASAHKVGDGFLQKRLQPYPGPDTLPFRCPNGKVGTMLLHHGHYAPSEPVNARAWFLEERVLSPRALIYGSHTLKYECQTKRVNINGALNFVTPFDGIPRLPDRIFQSAPTSSMTEGMDTKKEWQDILILYTQRLLTKPRDRLLALSGIVEQFHQYWLQSRYIAGLWMHQLPGALLWSKDSSERCTRPANYRAPSWSWAAIDGGITLTGCSNHGLLCTVEQCNAVLTRAENLYGEVTGGFIVLRAIMKTCEWDPVNGELFDIGQVYRDKEGPSEVDSFRSNGEIGYVVPDAVEDVSDRTFEVSVAVIRESNKALLGLVLVPVADNDGAGNENGVFSSFRRVGFFTAPFCDYSVWTSTARQLIKIV